MCADIDELPPQVAQFAEHYKGLAATSHAPIPPAMGVIEGSVGFIANDIERAREGDILAALQVAHFLGTNRQPFQSLQRPLRTPWRQARACTAKQSDNRSLDIWAVDLTRTRGINPCLTVRAIR